MRSRSLSRRTLLRGSLAGSSVAIGLPILESMLGWSGKTLADGSAIPKRFGVFFWGNGVRPRWWVPQQEGENWELSEELAPLVKVKDYVNVVSGMAINTGNEIGHHAGTVGILSGAPMVVYPHPNSDWVSTFSAPSIDQVAAEQIGKSTRFRSIEMGISRRAQVDEGTTIQFLSHNGPDSANPPEFEPSRLFDRVFGSGFKVPGADQTLAYKVNNLRRSVLDTISTDLTTLKSRVGASDRLRLDQHFENIRGIERRLATVEAPPPTFAKSCGQPTALGRIMDHPEGEPLEERSRAHADLLTMAFACDQTRVFSTMFCAGAGDTLIWQAGEEKSHHLMTHDEYGDQPIVHQAVVFIIKQLAYMLERFKETPEGEGNLLDSCVILASSDTSDARVHSIQNYPILVAGRAQGALKYPGIHFRAPEGENTSTVLLTVLRAAGLPLTTFGRGGGLVTQSCRGIESG